MSQVDIDIVLHRMTAILNVSHSRTVPNLIKGVARIEPIGSKMLMVLTKNTAYRGTIIVIVVHTSRVDQPLTLEYRKLYYNQLLKRLGRLSLYFM